MKIKTSHVNQHHIKEGHEIYFDNVRIVKPEIN